jgi:hypothetical protein
LGFFLGMTSPKEQGIEADQAPALPVHEPTIRANGVAPETQPIVIDWLSGVNLGPIAHIVVARYAVNRSAQTGQPVTRGVEVDLLARSVHAQITGVK